MAHSSSLRLLIAVVACVGGAGLAFLAGRATAPLDQAPVGVAASDVPVAVDAGAPTLTSPSDVAVRPPRRPVDIGSSEGPGAPDRSAEDVLRNLVPDATPQQLADAATRADAVRARAESSARQAPWTAARAVAAEIAKERAFLADEARGGTMNMLRALSRGGVRPFAVVQDAAEFGRHFELTTSGPEIDAGALDASAQPEPGSVVRFPPGYHVVRVSQWGRGHEPFPPDLVLEGAGRDRTVVRFEGFSARGEVRSLTFRDMTVDCGDDYLTDLRGSDPATIRMERCRVIGFDIGAGNSVMLSARTAAFYATDTRFEGGYGRSPGSGNVFDVGSGLLARLENCVFVGPLNSVYDRDSSATYVFDNCRFENVPVPLDRPPDGVRFVDCEIVEIDPQQVAAGRTEWQIDAMLPDESGARTVDGVAGVLPDGHKGPVALVFPAGEHKLDAPRSLGTFRGPLIVRGQGRDATLLRITGSPSSQVLIVRDATVDLGRSDLIRSQMRLVVLERVRLVRWDSGAGGSTAIDHRGEGIVVLRDCEVLDGFGRSPGKGKVAYLHDGSTLRIERSRVDLVGSEFSGRSGRIVLSHSVLNGLRAKEDGPQSKRWSRHVVVVNSTVTHRAEGAPKPERRSLSELNPNWSDGR